ncbi:SRPBCC family protein [Nocardioides bruguierae]|uniref:SRPBCC family protein n=1 Tax=Nocardioides bruguierae TaxID=2945102 RepID=UPI002021DC96|nr:SRPBCC family protein [Nocardioides bruguierae]MCL8026969.1 SRPBCC family protein [Nocardioides bruguierae]
MTTVERTVTTQTPIQQVWDYLSDFTTSEQWDPPSVSTTRVSGDGGVGTTYHNVSELLGSRTEVDYVVSAFDRPHRLQLQGDAGPHLALQDTITLREADGGGTEVTYHAVFDTEGAASLLAPVLPAGLKLLADRVAASLQDHLDAL